LLQHIVETTDCYTLGELTKAFSDLRPSIAPMQAKINIESVLGTIVVADNIRQIRALAQILNALGPTEGQARAAFVQITNAVDGVSDPDELNALAEAAHALGLAASELQLLRTPIYKELNRVTEPDQVATLADAVAILRPTPQEARAAIARVLGSVADSNDPRHVAALAQAHANLGSGLTEIFSDQVAEVLKARLATMGEPYTAAALAEALSIVVPANPKVSS
jgi:hypothetical protein